MADRDKVEKYWNILPWSDFSIITSLLSSFYGVTQNQHLLSVPAPFKEAGQQTSERDETKSISRPQVAKTESISPSLITYHDS